MFKKWMILFYISSFLYAFFVILMLIQPSTLEMRFQNFCKKLYQTTNCKCRHQQSSDSQDSSDSSNSSYTSYTSGTSNTSDSSDTSDDNTESYTDFGSTNKALVVMSYLFLLGGVATAILGLITVNYDDKSTTKGCQLLTNALNLIAGIFLVSAYIENIPIEGGIQQYYESMCNTQLKYLGGFFDEYLVVKALMFIIFLALLVVTIAIGLSLQPKFNTLIDIISMVMIFVFFLAAKYSLSHHGSYKPEEGNKLKFQEEKVEKLEEYVGKLKEQQFTLLLVLSIMSFIASLTLKIISDVRFFKQSKVGGQDWI